MKDKIIVGIVLAVIAAILTFLLINRNACVDSGGAYVRGMFGYECIKR